MSTRPGDGSPPAPTAAAVVLDGSVDPALVGGKAASLDRLVSWGFPVPPAGAVTTAAYRRLARHPTVADVVARSRAGGPLSADEVDAAFSAAAFPPEDAAAVLAMVREVAGGGPVAVRSSATVEDLATSSFAGQYRSLLHVDPTDPEAVLGAVRLVAASLWHPAPSGYRRRFGVEDSAAAMAVLVMAMVPARRAGVVFSVDPAGHPDVARVEAVEGLADDLVAGRVTPTALLVARDGPRPDVDAELAAAVDLALDVERRAGSAQDIEWAWDGEQVWIVQARPVTVSAPATGDGFDDDAVRLEGLDLTTAGIGETLPGVLPPLVWALSSFLVEEAFRALLSDLGVLPADLEGPTGILRRVRGRAAMDFSRLEDMAVALPGSASEQLEQEYFGSRRRGRPATGSGDERLHPLRGAVHDLRVLVVRGRAEREAATVVLAIAGVLGERPDLTALDDRALLAYHVRLVDLGLRAMTAELAVAADATATFGRLQQYLTRLVGRAGAGVAERLVARAGVTTPARRDASAQVFAGPTWDELGLEVPGPLAPAAPEGPGPGATGVVGRRRAVGELLTHLTEQLTTPRGELPAVARVRLRAVRRLAHDAVVRLSLREQAKAAVLALGGEVRRVHLEAGGRLHRRGRLERSGDVDLLAPGELRAVLLGEGAVAPAVVDRRRRWVDRYHQDPPLPARFTGVPTLEPTVVTGGPRLEGWSASAGRYRGRAQVVRRPTDRLEPGAVLVAEATDPSWSPLFVQAGAIVLDRGGPLSHSAILARELGVPAVLNVAWATTLLEGHDVTVDGDRGVVLVHDLEEPVAEGAQAAVRVRAGAQVAATGEGAAGVDAVVADPCGSGEAGP